MKKKSIPPAKSVKKTENGSKEIVKDFKHSVHLMEEKLSRLEKDKNTDPSLRKELGTVKNLIEMTKEKASSVEEVADFLGVDKAENLKLINPKDIVEESKFNILDLNIKTAEGPVSSPLKNVFPRGSFTKQPAGNTLTPFETLGKVRLLIHDVKGKPLPGVLFRVTASDVKNKKITLAIRSTDLHGYASLALNHVDASQVKDLKIEVDVFDEGMKKKDSVFEVNIHNDHLPFYRDAGMAHRIVIPEDLAPFIPVSESHSESTITIDDPDTQDIKNSPDSFGLEEMEEDGNMCLHPSKEFPARQYFFRQIVRISDPKKSIPLTDGSREYLRKPVKGPIPFGEETSGTYAVKGAAIQLGHVNLYRNAWFTVGRGVGELVYSLALAPCEHVNLAFIDWSRTEVDTRQESRTSTEKLAHEQNHERTIDEVVSSVLTEEQSGSSGTGGGGLSLDLGIFSIGGGGGYTSSSTSGKRELQASTVQDVSDRITQKTSAVRSQRISVVTTSTQHETENIQTRTVHNHNRNHAMTVQYFQVLSHYAVRTELVEEKPVLLIPYDIDKTIFQDIPEYEKFIIKPGLPITFFLDRHRSVLSRMLPSKFRPAFDALSRLLHCSDVYQVETPYATATRWTIITDQAWRPGITLHVETDDGQSFPLKNAGGNEFRSDPVRVERIDKLRISFDPVKAAESLGSLSGFLGDAIADMISQVTGFKLSRCEVYLKTDSTRFVPDVRSYRVANSSPSGVTLTASNPAYSVSLSNPAVSFDGYHGRQHDDYCRLKEMLAFIHQRPLYFLRGIWMNEDPERRALRFDMFTFNGKSLLDQVENKPVGVMGNYVAFPLLEGHKLVPTTQPNLLVSERIISMPTRGVFAEVYLSCFNATEKRDVERFIDPEQKCDINAPEISAITAGSRRSTPNTTPTDFPAPIVNIQNPTSLPDPNGLANALSVLKTPDIFRDLSRGAELLQFVNNATKEAFTSTRAHRAAMNEIAKSIVGGLMSAYTGVPMTGGGSSPGAASSGTTGITSGSSGSGGITDTSPISGSSNPVASLLSGEMLRQTSPTRLSDQMQTIQGAMKSGLISPETGSSAIQNLLGVSSSDDSSIIPTIILSEGSDAETRSFNPSVNDSSGVIVLRATINNMPSGGSVKWSCPTNAVEFTHDSLLTTGVTGLTPGLHDVDFEVKDSTGVTKASIKIPISIPQFYKISVDDAAFTTVLTSFQLDHVKTEILQKIKQVADYLTTGFNARLIWSMAPFNEALPAHLATGGVAVDKLSTVTIKGEPTSPGLLGHADPHGVGWGITDFNENIELYPGGYDDPGGNDVDDVTSDIINTLSSLNMSDPDILDLCTEIFGRLMGETMTHEIVHSLIGLIDPSNAHNPTKVTGDIMNAGGDRTFQDRTGIEVLASNFIETGDYTDHGIATINKPVGVSKGLLDSYFPVPPAF